MDIIEAGKEVAKDLQLVAVGSAAAARLLGRIGEIALFKTRRKGVVEIIEQAAACQQKLPGFRTIGRIRLPFEACLIAADDLVQAIVDSYCIRRAGIVEIKDRNVRVGIMDLGGSVGDVE